MASMLRRERLPVTQAEEQAKVKQLRESMGLLTGREEIYCSDACLHRYLRARNWNVKKAEKMLQDTLKWRAVYKPEEIIWDEVSHEGETGKMYRTNFLDKNGDSVLVLCPGRQNTHDHNMQIRHLVYCLENAAICLPEGREQMVWLLDFRGWTLRMSPPLKTSRETLNILQNHYPERLAAAILYDSPPMFEAFWKVIRPFMDPKTVKKVKFFNSKQQESLQMLEEWFDLDTLEKTFGGRSTWVYDHEAFGKMMKEDDRKTALHWKLAPRTSLADDASSVPPVFPTSDAPLGEEEEEHFHEAESDETDNNSSMSSQLSQENTNKLDESRPIPNLVTV